MKMNKLVSSAALVAIAGNVLMAGGDIVPVEPVVPEVVVSDSWEYSASIYLWAAAIGGTTVDGDDIEISFSDVVDNLDFGYMGNFGAKKGKWSFELDALYLKVGGSIDGPAPIDKIQLRAWVVTPQATYNVVDSDQWDLNLLAGARYLYMKPQITFSPAAPLPGVVAFSDSNWDGIIGIKGAYKLNEKWFMPFTFDIGTGDSDMTAQALVGVGYKYDNFDLIAGYRYLKWEFDDSFAMTYSEYDQSGPVIGTKFRF